MQMLAGDTKPDNVHVNVRLCVSPHARNVLQAVSLSVYTYPFPVRATTCTWTWGPNAAVTISDLLESEGLAGHPTLPDS
jgi:hypothetical protein